MAPSSAAEQALTCPEPEERPDLWPWSAHRSQGELHLGGTPVTELVNQYGTPLFVIDLADLAGRAQVWATAMAEEFWDGYGLSGGSAYYAGKAFLSGRIVKEVSAAGMGVDTASLGELTVALEAGADPARIGLHGNNKSREEIELALRRGIARIVIDSPDEVGFIQSIAEEMDCQAPVMMRLTTGVHAGGHDYISTAHEDQKFGLSLASGQAGQVAGLIKQSPNLRLVGLHSHIGSQIFELAGFEIAAQKVLAFANELIRDGQPVPEVDLGGGYAIAYTRADSPPPTPGTIARKLAEVVRQQCGHLNIAVPHISVEPGRSVIGPTAVTLYRVGTIKEVPLGEQGSRLYVSVDGGMSDNIRPALYRANYTATLANRESSAPLRRSRVVGKHCESGDIVIHDVDLPGDIKRGDLLAVPATGAYGYAMSSNYNLATRPAVVGVLQGETVPLIRAENTADLLSKDCEF